MVDAEPPGANIDPQTAVRWPQVATLGVLQGAISLSWIVYTLYLPALLITLGLDAKFAALLLLIEGVLAIALEPTFGFLSDQMFRRAGTRMPFIVAGVFLAAALFILIPLAVINPTRATESTRAIFVALVMAWAFAMSIFRTPAMSLLSR